MLDGMTGTNDEGRSRPVGRRIVLSVAALGALGVVLGRPLQEGIDAVLAPVRRADPTGLTDLVPGEGGWRYYSVTSDQPDLSTADYTLTVDGLVRRPATFTWDDLRGLPRTQWTRDFQCVTGWRVDDVRWEGVRLRDLLADVGTESGAQAVRFHSHDGVYTESLTLDQALVDAYVGASNGRSDDPIA
jgi:DMSO/TMAO reductase YedYZ molybdopterin-dependent catalytic subunit